MRSSAWHWEALGWSCTGLGVTVAGRAASVLRHARRTGSQAYFVLDVLVVSVFGGGGGGRGGAGVRVDSVRDGVLLVPRGAGHFGCAQRRGTHSANCAEGCSCVDVPVISSDKFPQCRRSNPLAPDSAHLQSGEHSCCATDFCRDSTGAVLGQG